MRGKWDEVSLAAVALCLACESRTLREIADTAASTADPSTTPSTSTSSGGSAGTEGVATSFGGTSSGSTSSSSTSSGGTSTSGPESASTAAAATTTTAGGGTGGQASSPDNETHACLEYVLGFCEFSARCEGGPESVIPCFEANSGSCPDVIFGPGSARTVDSTFACADAWRALACEVTRPECATAGTLADGEACVSGIQCASRLCDGSANSCGTCVPSVQLGAPCDDAVGPYCEPGLLCHGTDLVCVVASGQTVGGQEIGEQCDPTGSGCYPNACRLDDAGGYSCQPYPTQGEDCSELLTCAYGDSYCDATYVCLALPGAAEPCGVDSSNIAQWCAEGLVCDGTLDPPLCLAEPATPGHGEPCEGTCQAGFTCRCTDDSCDSKICQWARLDGESCAPPGEACLMGECIDGVCVVAEVESTFASVCGVQGQ